MDHKPIICSRCGLRMEDSGDNAEDREDSEHVVKRFVGTEQVCACSDTPSRHPFTSRPQPPNIDSIDRGINPRPYRPKIEKPN